MLKQITKLKLSISFAFYLSLFASPALAAATTMDDPVTQETIQRVQDYLTEMTTAKARFIQINYDGSYYEGDMYIKRPGRMRFEYDAPVPILLISDGLFLIHVDTELNSTTRVPVVATPANFLLQEKIDFSDNTTVTGYSNEAGVIRIELTENDNPDAGTLTLTLNDSPLLLRQWVVVDAQNLKTTITLINPEFGIELDPQLFMYNDDGKNQNRQSGDN